MVKTFSQFVKPLCTSVFSRMDFPYSPRFSAARARNLHMDDGVLKVTLLQVHKENGKINSSRIPGPHIWFMKSIHNMQTGNSTGHFLIQPSNVLCIYQPLHMHKYYNADMQIQTCRSTILKHGI